MTEIYVALLGEGVYVWRPVPAYKIDSTTFIVLKPDDYDAEIETWQFAPGSIVVVESMKIDGSAVDVAMQLANTPKQTA